MAKANFCIRSSILYRKKFLDLSMTAQALYFHLNCDADQDGIVPAYNTLQRTGCKLNDLTQLVPEFISVLDSEDYIVFVNDWLANNPGLDIRYHDGSEYLPLLAKCLPHAKVMVRIPYIGKNQKGEETTKYRKEIMTSSEAVAINITERTLCANVEDSPGTQCAPMVKRIEEKKSEVNGIEDKRIEADEWTTNLELLISRGLSPADAELYATKYTTNQLMEYISYTLKQPKIKNPTKYLLAALSGNWNIGEIIQWDICSNCDGEAFFFEDGVPSPCPICSGKGKIPKREEMQNAN